MERGAYLDGFVQEQFGRFSGPRRTERLGSPDIQRASGKSGFRSVILETASTKKSRAPRFREIGGPTRGVPTHRTSRMVAVDSRGHHHAPAHHGAGLFS